MKQIFFRYNDLRRKQFQIKTIIAEDNGKKKVIKEAICPEGVPHLENIVKNRELLLKAFPEIEVAPVKMEGNKLVADYIGGILLTDKYYEAAKQQDKRAFFHLVDQQAEWVRGTAENKCIFHSTDQFCEIFGDATAYEGQDGLKISNFEATPYNIVLDKQQKPTFIDYEWVFDFPMPTDFILYQCITSIYLMQPDLENLLPVEQVIKYLQLKTDPKIMRESYLHFFNDYQTRGKREKSLAEIKYMYLKGTIEGSDFKESLKWYKSRVQQLEGAVEWHHEYDSQLEENKRISEERINQLQKSLQWHRDKVKELEGAIEWHHRYDSQLEESVRHKDHQIAAKKEKLEQEMKKTGELQRQILEMENSVSWRATRFLRKR